MARWALALTVTGPCVRVGSDSGNDVLVGSLVLLNDRHVLSHLCLQSLLLLLHLNQLALFGFDQLLEVYLQLLLQFSQLSGMQRLYLGFLLLQIVDLFLLHLDMQFQLLLYFDMVSHFSFVLAELLLVFLRRQI